MTGMYPWIWLAAVVVFGIAEAATVQLVSIWFVIGAIAALLVSLFANSLAVQLVVFVLVSVLTLLVTRPMVAKKLAAQQVATNADMVLGKEAVALTDIDPLSGGRVKVDGQSWAARAAQPIAAGAKCRIEVIQGVTLTVTPIKEEVVC